MGSELPYRPPDMNEAEPRHNEDEEDEEEEVDETVWCL
jgi:hypothetical protein